MLTKSFLSFREQVLADGPIKIDIIHRCDDFFVINKPNCIYLDDTESQSSKNIVTALREKNHELFYKSVYTLDNNISGCSMIATNTKSLELLRNAYGSGNLLLKFIIICKSSEHIEPEILCTEPLVKHFSKPIAIISRNSGKKAWTKFKLTEQIGAFSLYEASCDYLRYHQIRIHASHCGLKILGETCYDNVPIPSLGDFKKIRHEKKTTGQLFHTQCIHLNSVTVGDSVYGNEITMEARPPKNFETLLKIIRKFA